MNGSQALIESMRAQGQKTLFGIPGGAVLPLYDALSQQSDVRHVFTRHEQGAVHAAQGFARASGQTGVCIGTSGPGATNLVTGIADAYMDSTNIIALMGQVPSQLLGKDAFQETDVFSMTLPLTKHSFKVMQASQFPSVVKSAYRIANTGRPGPVAIEMTKDALTAPVTEWGDRELALNYYVPSEPNQDKIRQAALMLLEAERPMMLAGGGVTIANAGAEFTALAEALMCFAATTITAKGVIPGDHPLCLGQLGMHGRQVTNHAIANCDVLLAVGTRFSDRITGRIESFAPHAKVIHVDIDPSEFNKNVDAFLAIAADAKPGLKELLRHVLAAQRSDRSKAWREKVKELDRQCSCDIARDEVPIRAERVIHELNRHLPENAIVCTEVGHHQMYATHFFKSRKPRHFITSAGAGTMGFGLPAAIGAKAAKPEQPVIDVGSEGSLVMVCQEMATAVTEKLPVSVCNLNNGWYAIVKQWQKLFYDGRYIASKLGDVPDWVKLTESFGGRALRVTRPSELGDAIKEAARSEELFLLDVITDSSDAGMPLVPPLGSNTEMALGQSCPTVERNYFGVR
ncbi:biosynthetic-type acetolactate synthase large subunit [Candidatus Micrarchaeota archaeon]|nr:biosynthetic-type acetolactate synthase large subunit [Candidatus Micrarchaeota archaeon]